jgi:hypothetical protein
MVLKNWIDNEVFETFCNKKSNERFFPFYNKNMYNILNIDNLKDINFYI